MNVETALALAAALLVWAALAWSVRQHGAEDDL